MLSKWPTRDSKCNNSSRILKNNASVKLCLNKNCVGFFVWYRKKASCVSTLRSPYTSKITKHSDKCIQVYGCNELYMYEIRWKTTVDGCLVQSFF